MNPDIYLKGKQKCGNFSKTFHRKNTTDNKLCLALQDDHKV